MLEQDELLLETREFAKPSADRPLIKEWTNDCLPALAARRRILASLPAIRPEGDGDVVIGGDIKTPSFLVPTMKLWVEQGPMIVTSYSHPEELDFYKVVAHLNLASFIDSMRQRGVGVTQSRVKENWYETIPLQKSARAPLSFGSAFPIKSDVLGIAEHRFGTEALDKDKQLAALKALDTQKVAETVVDRMTNELSQEFSATELNRPGRKQKRADIIGLVARRLDIVREIAQGVNIEMRFGRKTSVNEFLLAFEQKLAGSVLTGTYGVEHIPELQDLTGIEGTLSTANGKYAGLVLRTLEMLVESKGAQVLKDTAGKTGDGLFIGQIDNRPVMVSVDKESNRFIIRGRDGDTQVRDEDMLGLVRENGLQPLGKTEDLAMAAGGMTLHMGSEHGNRAGSLHALGITSEEYPDLRNYLSNLRIGRDLQQGNPLMVLKGGSQIMPAVLQYVLFGDEVLADKIQEVAGTTEVAEEVTDEELRTLVAKQLIKDVDRLPKGIRGNIGFGGGYASI